MRKSNSNAPEIKTSADRRTDIFVYNSVFDEYLRIGRVRQPLQVPDDYQIEYVQYSPETALSYLLDHGPGWRVLQEGPVAKLY